MAITSDFKGPILYQRIFPGLREPCSDIPFPVGVVANARCKHCGCLSLEKLKEYNRVYKKCFLCEREQ